MQHDAEHAVEALLQKMRDDDRLQKELEAKQARRDYWTMFIALASIAVVSVFVFRACD